MRILHVGESVMGGAGTYINELASLQTAVYGVENVGVLVPFEHKEQISDPSIKHIFTFSRANRKQGLLHLAKTSFKTIKTFRPDVVHAQSTFAGLIVRPICFLLNVPVVYCPHGWATDMEYGVWVKRGIAVIERILSSFCARIIAISEHDRKQGMLLGISEKKIVTVYNGIRKTPPAHTPASWEDTRLKILFVGRLDRQKGVDILLDAVEGLEKKVCLRIIGGAVRSNYQYDFRSFSHVEALGWCSPPEITAQIAASDVVVMPSRWEGFGLVAVEAMRLAKPVIASNVGGLPEVVVDGETGLLFPVGDVNALRQLLTSVEAGQLKKLGTAGQKRFIEKFTSDILCDKISEVYKACLS